MSMNRIRVLLVEDNPGDARLVQESLREAGPGAFQVDAVERLDRALAKVAERPYDIVLLDLSLPDSEGLDSLSTLRDRSPDAPVIVLTGLADERTAMAAVRQGAQDYLVKGRSDADALARAIRYAIERKAATRELEDLRRELAMSEKLASLGALVSGVAQEIRHATSDITATLYRLRAAVDEAAAKAPDLRGLREEVDECNAQALEGAARIDRMIHDLRRFYKAGPGERSAVSLDVPVRAAVDLFQATRREHVNIVADLGKTPHLALAEAEIQQVVLNLLANAAEAMGDQGTIHVTTRGVEGGGEIIVRDEGPGISADAERHIFEPFFTTKPEHPGLGLAIAHRIVAAHRGSIDVTSDDGAGTRARVFLPFKAA